MYQKLYAAHIFVSFPLPPLKFGPAIEGRQRKLVQKMKAHASESGQMHAQHIAICGQVNKKKYALCLGPNVSAGNGPRWRLKDTPTAVIFCCKSTDQHVRVRSKIYLRATVQDGVSGLHKIDTIYI